MVKRDNIWKSEHHDINWKGHRILVVSDHKAADQILAAAGLSMPAIPEGCNTVLLPFTTAGGCRALAVNQTGFTPEARDNERQVNGCCVAVLGESLGSDKLDDEVLKGFLQEVQDA